MPVFMFLVSVAALAFVASSSYAKKSAASHPPYHLDPQLDPTRRAMVETALAHEHDPGRLEAFANALANKYPNAAWYLRAKATALRQMAYGSPGPALPQGSPAVAPVGYVPAPAPAPSAPRDGLDADLPGDVRFNVIELLTNGSDPAMVDGYAEQLYGFPLAQAMVRARAAFLRSRAPAPAGIPVGFPQGAASAPFPTSTSLPTPTSDDGLEPGMSQEQAMVVFQALMTEEDPAKLRALANSIIKQFPVSAEMLLDKANSIAPLIIGPMPPAVPAVVPPSPSPAIPVFVSTTPPASPQPAVPALFPSFPPPASPPQTAPPAPSMPGLFDAGMSLEDQARIVTLLTSENDPARLRQIADAIAQQYPKAALALRTKADLLSAATLLTSHPPAPIFVPTTAHVPPPTIVPAGSSDSPGVYKVVAGDFPIKIAKRYGQPESAWKELVAANPQKQRAADGNFKTLLPGDTLAIPASWTGHRDDAASASRGGDVASPVVAATGTALDPGIPSDVAQGVLTALATETNPAELRGYASELMATYPVAASALLTRANTVGVSPLTTAALRLPSGGPSAASATTAATYAPASSHASPGSGHTYRVAAGDSPSRIAKKLTGKEGRWTELVAANPQKPKQPNGNFKTLVPGESLQLPASWTSQPHGAPTIAARA